MTNDTDHSSASAAGPNAAPHFAALAPASGAAAPEEVADARRLTRELAALMERARHLVDETTKAPALVRIEEIVGLPAMEAGVVEITLPLYTHASCQAAVEALRGDDPWFGLELSHQSHQPLTAVLAEEQRLTAERLPRPDWGQVAVSPTETMPVLNCGLAGATAPTGEPIVVVLRQAQFDGPPSVGVAVIAATPEIAQSCVDHLRRHIDTHSKLKGQVVSFGMSENWGNSLVSFLPRPDVSADDVVLPAGVLDEVVEHVIGIGAQASRLREHGMHLKRGVLLYGPPGTGKTHTVRHLIGRATDSTVVVLTGQGLRFIELAAALARQLAPSIVVCEDIDLIAEDRDYGDSTNPLLFQLLDAMDGVAGDADVTFVLTTNRASALEEALIQRPGRIDLAVEVPKPDQSGRERLLALYAGTMPVRADLGRAAERLAGATASAMKEVMRRAGLAALGVSESSPVITNALLDQVLQVYLDDTSRLTRSLLGATEASSDVDDPDDDVAGDDGGDA